MYLDTFKTGVGPVVDVHDATPGTFEIDQVPSPLGAIAPTGPVTVAVKVTVEPRAADGASALTATAGADLPTEVVAPDVGEVAK